MRLNTNQGTYLSPQFIPIFSSNLTNSLIERGTRKILRTKQCHIMTCLEIHLLMHLHLLIKNLSASYRSSMSVILRAMYFSWGCPFLCGGFEIRITSELSQSLSSVESSMAIACLLKIYPFSMKCISYLSVFLDYHCRAKLLRMIGGICKMLIIHGKFLPNIVFYEVYKRVSSMPFLSSEWR